MPSATAQAELPPPAVERPQTLVVNAWVHMRDNDDVRDVFVAGVPTFRYHVDDKTAERLVCAQLMDLRWVKARELAPVTGMSIRSLNRYHRQYVDDGAAALAPKRPGPKGPRMGQAHEAAIRQWSDDGPGQCEMARRLGVSQPAVRDALIRMGLPTDQRKQRSLLAVEEEHAEQPCVAQEAAVEAEPQAEAEAVPAPTPAPARGLASTLDTDPDNRVLDRLSAYPGDLDDAAPLFKDRVGLPRAGVLLAVPLIVQSGVLEAAHDIHGDLGPAFYRLRTSLMALLFMALLRIRNPESLKRYNPAELGWLMGLDRAPEVKTMRRKLLYPGEEPGPTEALLRELVRRRVAARQQALGFLYLDGHVRVYTGKADLPRANS